MVVSTKGFDSMETSAEVEDAMRDSASLCCTLPVAQKSNNVFQASYLGVFMSILKKGSFVVAQASREAKR